MIDFLILLIFLILYLGMIFTIYMFIDFMFYFSFFLYNSKELSFKEVIISSIIEVYKDIRI
jgi:hypothetical protein